MSFVLKVSYVFGKFEWWHNNKKLLFLSKSLQQKKFMGNVVWYDKVLENLTDLVYVLYILIVVQTKQKRDS